MTEQCEFTSDGCSGGMSYLWRVFTGKNPPWEDLCIEHDRAYFYGGPVTLRLKADQVLLRNMVDRGHPWIGMTMYAAVRVWGASFWRFSWCWGYGQKKRT